MSKFMELALKLAAKGHPSPNPMVGAVIVKGGRIIATGYHEKAGMPHAEAAALAKAGKRARGATLYVNLEPCSHWGRQPPCADAIIKAGISKVVFAMADPNPLVSGAEILRKNGIKIESGEMKAEAEALNAAFSKHIQTGMPYVTLKMAMTLDGKIATRIGDSKWISGGESRAVVQEMRARNAAILVGVQTVLRDDPSLGCTVKGAPGPTRVVLDSFLSSPVGAKVFRDSNAIVFCSKNAPKEKLLLLRKKGVRAVELASAVFDFRDVLRHLGSMGINSVLVEGGSQTAASAICAKCVDKIAFFIAPKIIGGKDAPGPIGGEGITWLKDCIELIDMKCSKCGPDLLVEAYPRYK